MVYRKSDGSVACLSDLCVHRGAALSKGELKGDCLVCPYHGWEYEPNGAVSKIPANPPGRSIPKKARVDSYPTIERYGFLWVFLGDLPEEERPPIPVWPEFEQTDKYRAVTGEYLWHSNYERIMENGTDIAHAPFVHGGVFGNPEKAEVADHVLEEDALVLLRRGDPAPAEPKGTEQVPHGRQDQGPYEATRRPHANRLDAAQPDPPRGQPGVRSDHHLRHQHPDRREHHVGEVGRPAQRSSRARGPTRTRSGARSASSTRTSASSTPCGRSCCPSTCPLSCS